MSNTTLTADVVARTALAILENELGVLKTVHRAYEDEFSNTVNGYKVGDTISIRRPADFTVRTGATLSAQDVIEGKTTLTIDQQVGVDFQFTSSDLTLKITDLSERVMKPAMSSIINYMANDAFSTMYKRLYHWVGTPGQTINSFADFALGPQRMDTMAMPMDGRNAALSPADHWGLLGSQTALYIQDAAKGAYREGSLGKIGGVETRMSQVIYKFKLMDLFKLDWNADFDNCGIDEYEQTAILTSIEHEFHTIFEDRVFENFRTFNEVKRFIASDLNCF